MKKMAHARGVAVRLSSHRQLTLAVTGTHEAPLATDVFVICSQSQRIAAAIRIIPSASRRRKITIDVEHTSFFS
jgi:hypothetical protein